jgi:hypothetical protein
MAALPWQYFDAAARIIAAVSKRQHIIHGRLMFIFAP